jgi:hypothetical protein
VGDDLVQALLLGSSTVEMIFDVTSGKVAIVVNFFTAAWASTTGAMATAGIFTPRNR